MKKVLLRGPSLSSSGYGVHTRQIARWLLSRPDVELTIHPTPWGITPWYLDREACGGLIGQMIDRSRDDKGPFDVSFQVQLPNEWTPGLAKTNVGVSAIVETTTCNPAWLGAINSMEHVIVPSTFTRGVIEKTGVVNRPDSLHVIPESFIDTLLDADSIKLSSFEFETKFNFLLVGQLTSRSIEGDRKNIFNTLKWFCETFKDNPDVGLIIKTNSGRETKIDRRVTVDTLRGVLNQVRKGPYPRVSLVHGMLTDDEMASLYHHDSIKAFLTLTRGEGYGLPILEAAAAGLPVIATNWSGHLDFMKFGRFIKVDFELKELPPARIDRPGPNDAARAIFMHGSRWAEPSEHDAKSRLLKFYERPAIPMQWAKELSPIVLDRFSHSSISKMYDELWEKL